MSPTLDAVELGRALIRCESVTPADGGALDLLKEALEGIGFVCQVKIFSINLTTLKGLQSVFNIQATSWAFGHFEGHAFSKSIVLPFVKKHLVSA